MAAASGSNRSETIIADSPSTAVLNPKFIAAEFLMSITVVPITTSIVCALRREKFIFTVCCITLTSKNHVATNSAK